MFVNATSTCQNEIIIRWVDVPGQREGQLLCKRNAVLRGRTYYISHITHVGQRLTRNWP